MLSKASPRHTHMLCFDVKARATYSAMVVESETVFCFFDRQIVVCPKVCITRPVYECRSVRFDAKELSLYTLRGISQVSYLYVRP